MNLRYSIPFPKKTKVLFILESPHSDELILGYPCAGPTGINMSKRIFNGKTEPFGKILNENQKIATNYGIFNSCQFPFNEKELLNEVEREIANITEVGYDGNQTIEANLGLHIKYLSEISNLDEKVNYTNQLNNILTNSPNIDTLVICGFIAQAFFQHLYTKGTIIKFNNLTKIKINNDRLINILYIGHPSPKNGEWRFSLSSIIVVK